MSEGQKNRLLASAAIGIYFLFIAYLGLNAISSLPEHIYSSNWFAVLLDFLLILVSGLAIGNVGNKTGGD